MPKSVGLLVVHGMGDTDPDFHRELTVALGRRLRSDWDRVAWRAVYYQPVLQNRLKAIFEQMRPDVRWEGLRELMLFGFSDAASLEHKKELPGSPYLQTQRAITAHSVGHVPRSYVDGAQADRAQGGAHRRAAFQARHGDRARAARLGGAG